MVRWSQPLLAALACSGCLHTGYLVQAAHGQDEIAYRSRPIEEVLEDRSVPAATREMLRVIGDVKRFGEEHGIKPTNSYREYADLRRPAVVWVVTAAKPLAFESKTWWFPIVGSVPYLGWFNRRDAERFAKQLEAEGWDVDMRGASAYSTLGWFDDPVLSTMIRDHDSATGSLVNVVLHESVHATHYVESQSSFNESLADFVADTLTPEYLTERLGFDRWQMLDYRLRLRRGEQRAQAFHEAYKELDAVYRSKMSDADKLAEKRRITEELRAAVGFERPINNATLAQSRTYHGGVPELAKVLACVGGDWRRFWERIATIDADDFAEPQQEEIGSVLRPLLRDCQRD